MLITPPEGRGRVEKEKGKREKINERADVMRLSLNVAAEYAGRKMTSSGFYAISGDGERMCDAISHK